MARKKVSTAEETVRNIRRKTRKKYSGEEKIRIGLEGLRGEQSIAGPVLILFLTLPITVLSTHPFIDQSAFGTINGGI